MIFIPFSTSKYTGEHACIGVLSNRITTMSIIFLFSHSEGYELLSRLKLQHARLKIACIGGTSLSVHAASRCLVSTIVPVCHESKSILRSFPPTRCPLANSPTGLPLSGGLLPPCSVVAPPYAIASRERAPALPRQEQQPLVPTRINHHAHRFGHLHAPR
jgi:hypothetical protein